MDNVDEDDLGAQPEVEDTEGRQVSVCPGCGRAETAWRGDGGSGYLTDDGVRYCCAGCYDETICICK